MTFSFKWHPEIEPGLVTRIYSISLFYADVIHRISVSAEFNLVACRKKRRGNQNPFMFFFARMLLILVQWPPELCAHRAKKMPHTNTRNNNRRKSTNNGTSSWHLAEVEQKNTRRNKTKQHQVVFQPGLTLPLSHTLSLPRSVLSAIYIQSSNWTIQPDTANDCGADECWQYFAINLSISFSLSHWWNPLARVPFVQSPSGTGTVETLMESGVTL